MKNLRLTSCLILLLMLVSWNLTKNPSNANSVQESHKNLNKNTIGEDEEDFSTFFNQFCTDVDIQKSRNKTNERISIEFEPDFYAYKIIFDPKINYYSKSKNRVIYYYYLNQKKEQIETYKFQFTKNKWFLVDFKNENIKREESNQSVLSFLFFMQTNKTFMKNHLIEKMIYISIYPNYPKTKPITEQSIILKNENEFLPDCFQLFSSEDLLNNHHFRIVRPGEGCLHSYFFRFKDYSWILVKEQSECGC